MPKILRATGAHGNQGKSWNWCDPDEIVGVHGSVCDNSCTCGCGRSFSGIVSAKACTQAIVEDVTEEQFKAAKERLHATTKAGWHSEEIADDAVASLDRLSKTLARIPAGRIANIDGDQMTFNSVP